MFGHAYSVRVLYAGWQFLPADALADHPIRAVWHLHHQPPVWNLLVGGVAAWTPIGLVASHALISVATGMALAATVTATLVQLGVSPRRAVLLAIVATANTQIVWHAFEPRYDLAVAALLALLVWSVARQVDSRARSLLLPSVIATTLAMTRALYHPVWVLLTLGVLAWLWRDRLDRRRALAALAVPMLVIGGWIVKNEMQFGRATLSSWTGMNLLRSVEPAISPGRIDELYADRTVSGVALAGHFRLYDDYVASVPRCEVDQGADPVLTEPYRPIPPDQRGPLDGPRTANFNYECYLEVYDRAGADARALIVAEPGGWLRARAWSLNNWLAVPPPAATDDDPLWRFESAVTRLVLLGAPHPGLPAGWRAHEPWVVANPLSLTLLVTTSALLCAAWRRRHAAYVVAAVAVLWTMFAGLVFELGEQARFRSVTDPLVLSLGGLVLIDAAASAMRRRARSTTAV
jgi:hypothetical protein